MTLSTSRRACPAPHHSRAALRRFRALEGRPLFRSDWIRAVFIHYEVDPAVLQPEVPFELDCFSPGRAVVSVVAFVMRNLRLAIGGRIGALLTAPVATHGLLNVRTYVLHQGEAGIYFISEWIPNRLSVLVGPHTYGLPYRFGRLDYRHDHERGEVRGTMIPGRGGGRLDYVARLDDTRYRPCEPGTQAAFLLERYTAYTRQGPHRRLFRIWHRPWPQVPLRITVLQSTALASTGSWHAHARLIGANYSPGVHGIWMGRPRPASHAGRS